MVCGVGLCMCVCACDGGDCCVGVIVVWCALWLCYAL